MTEGGFFPVNNRVSAYIVIKHEKALLGTLVLLRDNNMIQVRRGCGLIPGPGVQEELLNKALCPKLGCMLNNVFMELLI